MMYKKNLRDTRKEMFDYQELYGYDNVTTTTFELPISEVEWIKMHLVTPIENLRNGLEIRVDEEDYETAALITKIINWLEGSDDEIVFDLKNTEGYTKFKVKKNRKENP